MSEEMRLAHSAWMQLLVPLVLWESAGLPCISNNLHGLSIGFSSGEFANHSKGIRFPLVEKF